MASLLPKSTIKLPNSVLLTTPIAISPTLSLNSLYCLDLSASLTFWIITPLAFCAATLPRSIWGSFFTINSPIFISGSILLASSSKIWLIWFYYSILLSQTILMYDRFKIIVCFRSYNFIPMHSVNTSSRTFISWILLC